MKDITNCVSSEYRCDGGRADEKTESSGVEIEKDEVQKRNLAGHCK